MSVLIAVSVLDQKVGAFFPPMFVRSKGEAVRSFFDACADQNTQFYKHPTDFQLYQVGSYDDATGLMEPCTPALLATGERVEGK